MKLCGSSTFVRKAQGPPGRKKKSQQPSTRPPEEIAGSNYRARQADILLFLLYCIFYEEGVLSPEVVGDFNLQARWMKDEMKVIIVMIKPKAMKKKLMSSLNSISSGPHISTALW